MPSALRLRLESCSTTASTPRWYGRHCRPRSFTATRFWPRSNLTHCQSTLVRQPATRKAGLLQPRDDVGIFAHRLPDQIRPVILDHRDYRTLIDPQVIRVEPALARDDPAIARRAIDKRRIEVVHESVVAEQIVAVFLAHGNERGNGDLRSERYRSSSRSRRNRAVILNLVRRSTPRPV